MKRNIILTAAVGVLFVTSLSSAFAEVCPNITINMYNDLPLGGPFNIIAAGKRWSMLNNQGRAQAATQFSAPINQNSTPCTYDANSQCCSYNATIGGNQLNREFQYMGGV